MLGSVYGGRALDCWKLHLRRNFTINLARIQDTSETPTPPTGRTRRRVGVMLVHRIIQVHMQINPKPYTQM